MTSYGRNKNHDDEMKKNQEKANNSPSYHCAAIKKNQEKANNSLSYRFAAIKKERKDCDLFHVTGCLRKKHRFKKVSEQNTQCDKIPKIFYPNVDTIRTII